MNKQFWHYFKVGATASAFLALLILFFSLVGNKFNKDHHINIMYRDARGIQKGEIIQMAGVNIGQVDDVRLTDDNKRALVRVGVHSDTHIPEGSHFVIQPGVLGNTRTLTVIPNYQGTREISDEASVEGESANGLDTALAQSQKLIESSQKLVASITRSATAFEKLSNDPATQKSLKNTFRNIEESTANLPILQRQLQSEAANLSLQANQLLAGLQTTKKSVDQIAVNTAGLTSDFRDTLKENRGNLRALIRDADEAVSGVAGLTDQLTATLGDKKIQNNLTAATDNLVSISARLDATTANFERLSGDPRLTSDLRETLSNLKETSASVKNLTARVEAIRLPGEKRRPGQTGETPAPPTPARPFSATSLLEPGLVFDAAYDTKGERLRTDVDYTLLAGPKNGFYRLGVTDFTEGNRLNAQIGSFNGTPARYDYRYGIVSGKLGGGMDFRTGPLDLRFDVFDPNRLTINARAKAYLNKDSAITFGINSLGNGNRATLGVQIKK